MLELKRLIDAEHTQYGVIRNDIENGKNSDEDAEGMCVSRLVTIGIFDLMFTHAFSDSSQKSIGMLGSMAIAVNALAGPAILQLPFTFQQAGIVPTTTVLIFVAAISALCCMHMANVVSKVPGNFRFDKEVEFSDPFRTFWSKRAYIATQILFYLCTLSVNVAAIIDTAEVLDSFLGHLMGTWGFAFDDWEFQQWSHDHPCSRRKVRKGICMPFADTSVYGDVLLTSGYLITAAVFLPICLMDLKV